MFNFTVFELVIITDNLQKLRFYQRSSKTMNDNIMFRTKFKILRQKTVLKLLLAQTLVKLRNLNFF